MNLNTHTIAAKPIGTGGTGFLSMPLGNHREAITSLSQAAGILQEAKGIHKMVTGIHKEPKGFHRKAEGIHRGAKGIHRKVTGSIEKAEGFQGGANDILIKPCALLQTNTDNKLRIRYVNQFI